MGVCTCDNTGPFVGGQAPDFEPWEAGDKGYWVNGCFLLE